MKNILFPLVILWSLILSCSTDIIDATKNANNYNRNKKLEQSSPLVEELTPENPANIYDFAGRIHNDILDTYLKGSYQDTTIIQISEQIEAIVAQNNDFMLLNSTNIPVNFIVIQEIINEPQALQNQIIANSSMSFTAKNSLSNFMNAIALRENDSYQEVYEFIISYESVVSNDETFNNDDRRIILTISSIIRYSAYYYAQNKDKDWGTSGGHRIGSLSGAMENITVAIRRALIVGIRINKL